ncbi:MAG: DNA-(apurinic or apyrimidinic site) lyase/endonuclease [Verrucomicrobiales bacterium]|nr:DNA-(apurinic or apyrimidinic site) lyase/endonuclease [Verrucomicrobiales bacterium]
MPRESFQAKQQRSLEIIERLSQTYPNAHCELNFSNPLELLIATILSAQCTDKQVNIVTAELFRKYRTAADFSNAKPEELEQDIKRIGLFRSKAKNIQACCRTLVEKHRGEVPRSLEELVQLGGVGRKTANVVLGNAYGINSGVVVDTHVGRLCQLLGMTRESQPEKIEQDLQKLVPHKLWTMFSHWMIWHGRRRCSARKPDCQHCEIQKLCPAGTKMLLKDQA